MAWELEREVDHLETIGELRAAIADLPDAMPLVDGFDGCPLLQVYRDIETGDLEAIIR